MMCAVYDGTAMTGCAVSGMEKAEREWTKTQQRKRKRESLCFVWLDGFKGPDTPSRLGKSGADKGRMIKGFASRNVGQSYLNSA